MSVWHPRVHLRHPPLGVREPPRAPTSRDEEPTLGALLHRLTRTAPPERFYQGIQLALPWGAWFAWTGWLHVAGICGAVGLFGIWGALSARERGGELTGWRRWVARASATGAIALAALVVLDLFRRLLGSAPIS